MSQDNTPKQKNKRHPPRRLRKVLIALGVVVALPAAAVLSLPAALSSNYARDQIVRAVAEASGRETSLREIRFGWSDGLRLTGLRIGPGGPENEKFLCALGTLHANVAWRSLLRGRAALDVELSELRVRARIPKTPPTPLPETLSNLFAMVRTILTPMRLPIDVALHAEATDGDAHLILSNGAPLRLRDLVLRLDAPSLKREPLVCHVSAAPIIGGRELRPIRLVLDVAGLCDAAGRLDMTRAQLAAKLEVPGGSVFAGGNLTSGLNVGLRADLRDIGSAYAPLAGGLPKLNGALSGKLFFARAPSAGSRNRLALALSLHAEGLRLAKGPLGAKAIGPFAFTLRQNGEIDAARETANLPGVLTLAGQSRLAWTARLTGVRARRPNLAFELRRIRLQAAPLLAAVKDFLPPGFSLDAAELTADAVDVGVLLPKTPEAKPGITANARGVRFDAEGIARVSPDGGMRIGGVDINAKRIAAALPGTTPGVLSLTAETRIRNLNLGGVDSGGFRLGEGRLDIGRAKIRFPDSGKPGSVSLAAGLRLRDLAFAGAGHPSKGKETPGDLRIAGASLDLTKAEMTLPGAGRPGRVALTAGGRAQGISVNGAVPTTIDAVDLAEFSLAARNLARDDAALFGMRGSATVALKAETRDLKVADLLSVPEIRKRLDVHADLPAGKSAAFRLTDLVVQAPRIFLADLDAPRRQSPTTSLSVRLAAPEIRLARNGGNGKLVPAMRDARLGLDLGDALHVATSLSLTGPAGRSVASRGSATINARPLLALAEGFIPGAVRASGTLAAQWRIAAEAPSGPLALPTSPGKLSQGLKRLGFLHDVEIGLALRDVNLDMPLPADDGGNAEERLRLRNVNTPRPLLIRTKNGVAESSLEGAVSFGPLNALPGVGELDRPLRGLLSFSARQENARSAQIAEALKLNEGGLEQRLTLGLDKLGLVLDSTDKPSAALEHLDARLAFGLAGKLDALPVKLGSENGFGGSGQVEVGADVRLAGGRGLTLSGRLLSPGLDLRLGPNFSVSGLKSSLRFRRSFGIAPDLACPEKATKASPPLSEQVFDQFPAGEPYRKDDASLAGLLAPDPDPRLGKLTAARAEIKAGPLPLDLRDIELRVDAASALPGLRSFRAGLLGGGVLGGANLRRDAGEYRLEANLAFSGVDPGRLFPAKVPRDLGDKAETSGRLSLVLPLTADPAAFLRNLLLRADITKIGPKTLERLLYALDPDEQNEAIVQERRLMDLGYPRHLHANVAYGNLSLSGAVEVKGIRLDLPPVDRLNIANLPIRKKLAAPLAATPQIVKALDAATGTVICRDPNARIRVVRPAASQGANR